MESMRLSDKASEHEKIWRSEVMGTQKCSLPSSKFTIYLILLTNIMLLMSLILAISWIRVIYELCNEWALLTMDVSVAQWKSIRAWKNPKVWGHGDPEIFLCLTLMTRQKTPFSISLPNSKTYHLPYSIKSYLGKTVTKSDW